MTLWQCLGQNEHTGSGGKFSTTRVQPRLLLSPQIEQLPSYFSNVRTFPQSIYINDGRKDIFLTSRHLLSSVWIEIQMAHLLAHSKTWNIGSRGEQGGKWSQDRVMATESVQLLPTRARVFLANSPLTIATLSGFAERSKRWAIGMIKREERAEEEGMQSCLFLYVSVYLGEAMNNTYIPWDHCASVDAYQDWCNFYSLLI